ncbi:(2Fe-2S) ferredoxin domain-containing protein [Desulfoscipio geothermicus]|uniref:NAD(P)-dependent iron-only hydrogenase iron-sulfur protein n=1 Tax=Desulfoscipio geothermicus DSM 3669 TaxID=1121426 RepID=A0A1I6E6V5_9FIRM|nr:(2Fe-2S) ferredoxin domain-containing protein [Desulfoscipio geothermicus]SFR13480.1 NAD(P)-dependent iron-only hydrogenase iron-sulfur protein [Desulfoscipio geothermicus DSM 3669]
MKSLAELDKLREKLRQEMNVREKDHDVTVTVSMGTCGIAAGAREIVKALLEEMKEQGLSRVALTQTSCAGLCQHEPLVEVNRGNEKITYINVDRDKAREIVKKHLVAGQVIKEWTTPERS